MNRTTQGATALSLLMAVLLPSLLLDFLVHGRNSVGQALVFSLLVAIVMLVAGLVFGSPLFFFLHGRGAIRWWSALLSGSLVGLCTGLLFALTAKLVDVSVAAVGPLVLLGAASGLVFWLFWHIGHRVFRRFGEG